MTTSTTAPSPKWRRALAAVLVLVAAGSLQRSTTLPWGFAVSGPQRIEVSPIGITRTSDGADRQLCRWWPISGEPSLCAPSEGPGAREATTRLRMGYPLLQVGFWVSTIALFLIVLRVPRPRVVRFAVTLFASICGLVGTLCVVMSAPVGLQALSGIPIAFRMTGAMLAWLGVITAFVSALLQLTDE